MKNTVIEESNIDRARKEREEKKKWKKPQPPAPFLNHLNVIATTQYFDEYLDAANTTKSDSVKYVDTQLGLLTTYTNDSIETLDSDRSLASSSRSSSTITTSEEEKNTIEFVVCNLLRLRFIMQKKIDAFDTKTT